MSLDSIPLGRIARMQWAMLDTLITSDLDGFAFANAFGRVQLPGQVTVGPGSTTVTGAGTDFTAYRNERLILGDQLVRVLSVTSSTELELRQPHADGLAAPTDFYQAPRGYVMDTDPIEANLPTLGWPAFTISTGEIQPIETQISCYTLTSTLLLAMYFESADDVHLEPRISASDLAHQAELILTASTGLAVPRFADTCLADNLLSAAQGSLGVRVSNSNSVRISGLATTWRTRNALANLPAFRWL